MNTNLHPMGGMRRIVEGADDPLDQEDDMTEGPARGTEEFQRLANRFQWGADTAAEALGRAPRTIRRWKNGRQDVERSDLAFMRRIESFLDKAPVLYGTPPGDMDSDEFRDTVYALGWNWRPRNVGPFFADAAGLPPMEVLDMALGARPVPLDLQHGLSTLLRYLRDMRPDDPQFQARLRVFLGDAPELHASLPGDMTAAQFRAIVEALGFDFRPRQHGPFFAEVANLPPLEVLAMATGKRPVSSGLQRELEGLREELSEPPVLAARLKAQQERASLQLEEAV